MSASGDEPTPPTIVSRADNPPQALAAFIAQELEHWGFTVESAESDPSVLWVGGRLTVTIDDSVVKP